MAKQPGGRAARIAFSVVLTVTSVLTGAASAQSGRYGGGGITVYTNPNFGGQSATFRTDTPDLRPYSLNDKISSLDIPNGESWEVCQDVNYGNRCQVFSGSVPDLRRMGWNDRISSLRRLSTGFGGRRGGGVFSPNASAGSQRLVLYDRPNFRGNSMTVTGDANGGLGNRLPGSAEVRGGTWEVCDRTGRCATVSRDVPDLSRLGLSGRITSARPVNRNQNSSRYDQGGWNGRRR